MESLSYIEDEELSEWILSNKKTPLITILNLACSDEVSNLLLLLENSLNDFLR